MHNDNEYARQKAAALVILADGIKTLVSEANFYEAQLEDEGMFMFYNFPVLGAMPTDAEFQARFDDVFRCWYESVHAAEILSAMLRESLDD